MQAADLFQTEGKVIVVGIVNAHPTDMVNYSGKFTDPVRVVVALQHLDGRKFQSELTVNVAFLYQFDQAGTQIMQVLDGAKTALSVPSRSN